MERSSSPSSTRESVTPTEEERNGSLSRFKPSQRLTLMRFLQDLPNAETPASPMAPKYHTGKVPNSKAGDGKPRLLLMGQRR
jgi:Ras-related GTP-binding protein C/D